MSRQRPTLRRQEQQPEEEQPQVEVTAVERVYVETDKIEAFKKECAAIDRRYADEVDRRHAMHLKHYHMPKANFRKMTSELKKKKRHDAAQRRQHRDTICEIGADKLIEN